MKVFNVLYRVANKVPCIFVCEYPVNYGNILCFDNEGFHEAHLDYYYKTKPARTPQDIAACEALAHAFDTYDSQNVTAHKRVHKINHSQLRANWS